MIWIEWKHYLSTVSGLSQDALHIYVALLIQFGGALLLRRSLADPLTLGLVLLAVVLNEAGDLYFPGSPIESWQVDGSIKDLWNTMLAPTLIWAMACYYPRVFQPAATRISADPE